MPASLPDQSEPVGETTHLLDPPFSSEQAIDDNDEEDIRLLRESRAHHSTKAWHSRPSVPIICVAVFVFFLQEMTGLSSFVVEFMAAVCRQVIGNDPELQTCHDSRVQSTISDVQMKMLFVVGLLSCIASGKLGEISDRIGRRKVLIFCGVLNLIMRCAYLYLLSPSISFHAGWFILAAALGGGLGGGNVLLLSLASSYITDIVEPKLRTRALGFIMGSFYIGMAIGPIVGSFIIKQTGNPRASLWAAAGFAALFLVLVIFGVKESRPKMLRTRSQSLHLVRKASFSSQRSGATGAVADSRDAIYNVFKPMKMLWLPRHTVLGFKPRFNIALLVFLECCCFFASVSNGSVLVLYATSHFELSSVQLGYYISLVGFAKSGALYVFSPAILHFMRNHFTHHEHALDHMDWILLIFGSLNDLIAPLIIWLATSMNMIFISAVVGSLGAVLTPTIQSTIMKYYPESKSGEVFGALSILKNIIVMIGPASTLFVYGRTVAFGPSLVFLLLACLVGCGVVAAFMLQTHQDIELSAFMKSRAGSICSLESDNDNDSVSVPCSPMRVYDAVRRGSAGGATPRDPVSF